MNKSNRGIVWNRHGLNRIIARIVNGYLYQDMSGLTLCKLSNVIALNNMNTKVRNHGTCSSHLKKMPRRLIKSSITYRTPIMISCNSKSNVPSLVWPTYHHKSTVAEHNSNLIWYSKNAQRTEESGETHQCRPMESTKYFAEAMRHLKFNIYWIHWIHNSPRTKSKIILTTVHTWRMFQWIPLTVPLIRHPQNFASIWWPCLGRSFLSWQRSIPSERKRFYFDW